METLTRILLLTCFPVLSESTNMTGSVFTFPREEYIDHVTLRPHDKKPLSQASLCLRIYSDQYLVPFPNSWERCFFSLANSSHFILCSRSSVKFTFHFENQFVEFTVFKGQLAGWNSVCMTWDGEHIIHFFINGEASVRKQAPMQPGWQITTNYSLSLGGAKLPYGGAPFTGHMTDFHMWDHVISTCEIHHFMNYMPFQPGNYLKWQDLNFEAHGKARVEKMQLFSTNMC